MENINNKKLSIFDIDQKQKEFKKLIDNIDQWIIKIHNSYKKDLPDRKDPNCVKKTIALNKIIKIETDLLLAIKKSALEQTTDLKKLENDFKQAILQTKPGQSN